MNVTKSAIYRISVDMNCGCVATKEFKDANYKEPITEEAVFVACAKHKGKAGVDILQMVLSESVDKEAKDHLATSGPTSRPNVATTNANGELEVRAPLNVRTVGRVAVRPAGTTAVPGRRPVNAAQAARTGPVAAPRSTMSTAKAASQAAPTGGLAAALAEPEEIEDDLLAANDPERQY
jgi:hypothetical protein